MSHPHHHPHHPSVPPPPNGHLMKYFLLHGTREQFFAGDAALQTAGGTVPAFETQVVLTYDRIVIERRSSLDEFIPFLEYLRDAGMRIELLSDHDYGRGDFLVDKVAWRAT
jgi:hypothetical protein